jgi:hypothetical protein
VIVAHEWGISPAELRDCTAGEYARMLDVMAELAERRRG